jgi:SAM-dependent methyltransferase
MYRLRRTLFVQEMSPLMAHLPRRRVLDVGSGSGFYVDLWRALGAASIVATDITDVAVERLRAAYADVAVERWTLGEPPPPAVRAQRFGAISAMDVLYHVLEDDAYARAFDAFYELLEPDGALVFTENCLHGHELRIGHQRSRTLGRILGIARAAGFEVVRRRPQFWLMNAPHDSRHAVHRWWWRGVSAAATRSELAGTLFGAALYFPDLAASELLREGPSTELLLCRRVEKA